MEGYSVSWVEPTNGNTYFLPESMFFYNGTKTKTDVSNDLNNVFQQAGLPVYNVMVVAEATNWISWSCV
jgi:hypothetical protein